MGMSTNVEGFRPPDKKWKKMKAVWDSCRAANINAPSTVREFFGHDDPDDSGVRIQLVDHECCSPVLNSYQDGFEIDLSKLPKDINIIRFYNSY